CSTSAPCRRSECQSVSEPCGSASITRQRWPSPWAKAARWAVIVVLPVPPLRDATVMTFMNALPRLGDAPAWARMVNEWLYWNRAMVRARCPMASLPFQHQGTFPANQRHEPFRDYTQKPGQRHFKLHMVLGNIKRTVGGLAERAHAEGEAIAGPGLLLQGDEFCVVRAHMREAGLDPAHRLLAPEMVRNGD